jgi:hypothetical protein
MEKLYFGAFYMQNYPQGCFRQESNRHGERQTTLARAEERGPGFCTCVARRQHFRRAQLRGQLWGRGRECYGDGYG